MWSSVFYAFKKVVLYDQSKAAEPRDARKLNIFPKPENQAMNIETPLEAQCFNH